ncbi:orange carotenoid-binding protein [Synechococcus sp. Tobar12-5m-g]|uniref:orange carotenoid protein N-terminal domain-containing protein n=1 Tax=unclassified Synechococcus TaxID=2626047 RepID=UPI0020CD48E0|nr:MULTISPECIES: orange carotenoid protein N-terminal domain-containing protein [unclassified Synechococcus]MCP9771163.1 orange carotenoid-binding protein [Synechococcus sp. Tobar12-5m-g]MCP9872103.1 orange carotenoid-binding protein [Synechococcus sp. Cruz CV-v-12]
MSFTIESAFNIFPETLAADVVPATIARFNQLGVEDKLALIWFAYLEMGKTLSIATPDPVNMQFASSTLSQIKLMNFDEQSQLMHDLASRTDRPICRIYATWSVNIKLGFWYQLGKWMEEGIVTPIPQGYQLSANSSAVLQAIRVVDTGQQITILRNAVVDMGFEPAQLGSYSSVAEPLVPPQDKAKRTPIASIPGVEHTVILEYMDNLNANDFDALVNLFASDGALQPPFQRPIVGQEALLRFFREDCQNLTLLPERGITEPDEDGYTRIKVTGKVQTPWFGQDVGMNVAWRFLLNPENKIFVVAIDLLASAKELLNLAP